MIVPVPQFTAPSYGNRTSNLIQRCVNLYPEQTADGTVLVSTPGITLQNTTANNLGCRGAYHSSTGRVYSVHGGVLYENFTTSVGTLVDTSGLVVMSDNGVTLVIADINLGARYSLNMNSGGFASIADANCPLVSSVTYHGGYYLIAKHATGEVYISELDSATDWTPINMAEAKAKGDILAAVISNGSYVYFIGKQTTEIWYQTGNGVFQFEQVNGSVLQIGATTHFTVAGLNSRVYFLSSPATTKGAVWELDGTTVKRISTPYIESKLGGADLAGTFGITYEIDGKGFYQITGTNAADNFTFVYDIGSGAWHQKESLVSSVYGYDRLRFILNIEVNYANAPRGFDAYNGISYSVGVQSYVDANSENGTAIRRERIFGPIESGTKKVFHRLIRIEADVIFDATGTTSMAPVLDWTDDGGLTYATARTMTTTVTSSTTGQRVVFRANRLGASASRYYRLRFTGPAAKIILKKCELDLEEGRF